jgi:alkylation response protein AidB-like acyl-CoA dehydrogenase
MSSAVDFLVPTPRSEEQDLIAEVVSKLNDALPLTVPSHPRQVWDQLVELGMHGVLLDAEQGTGVDEATTIAATLGAGLNAETFVWGAVAVPRLLSILGPSASVDDLVRRIDSGALATLAMHGRSGDLDEIGRSMAIRSEKDAAVVTGEARFVPYPRDADVMVILVSDADGIVVAEVLDAAAVAWEHLPPLDLRTPLGHATFEDVPVRVLGRLDRPVVSALSLALFCQAAAIAGSAQRALIDAVEYSRIREQFGVPIAQFQAIRHRLAEALLEVELMHTALSRASQSRDEWSMLLASYHCMAAAAVVVRANIQVHGGIGYTWEHTAHRHYRYAFAGSQAICSLESLERHLMGRLVGGGSGAAADE